MSAPLAHLLTDAPDLQEAAAQQLTQAALDLYVALDGPDELEGPPMSKDCRALHALGKSPSPAALRLLVLHRREPATLAWLTASTQALTQGFTDPRTGAWLGYGITPHARLLLRALWLIKAIERPVHGESNVFQRSPEPVYSDAPI
jgi:hypothetical protein